MEEHQKNTDAYYDRINTQLTRLLSLILSSFFFFWHFCFPYFSPSISSKLQDYPLIQWNKQAEIYFLVIFRSNFHLLVSSSHTPRELTTEENLSWGKVHHQRGTGEEEWTISLCPLSQCLKTLIISTVLSHPYTNCSKAQQEKSSH